MYPHTCIYISALFKALAYRLYSFSFCTFLMSVIEWSLISLNMNMKLTNTENKCKQTLTVHCEC